jgi:hypothetical protein
MPVMFAWLEHVLPGSRLAWTNVDGERHALLCIGKLTHCVHTETCEEWWPVDMCQFVLPKTTRKWKPIYAHGEMVGLMIWREPTLEEMSDVERRSL